MAVSTPTPVKNTPAPTVAPKTEDKPRSGKKRSVFAVDLPTAEKIKSVANALGVTPRKIHELAVSDFLRLDLNAQKRRYIDVVLGPVPVTAPPAA